METIFDLFAPVAEHKQTRTSRNAPIVGLVYGRLTIVSEAPKRNGVRQVLCRCECGKEKVVALANLRKGNVQSCGCLREQRLREVHTKHGHYTSTHGASPTYNAWSSLRTKCHNPRSGNFHMYGGAGITMCDEWRASFAAFLRDMGERPQSHTIRLLGDAKEFGPGKCAWSLK